MDKEEIKNRNIWEDEEGILATEPIDNEMNQKSNLLQSLTILMQIQDKISTVSDLAFDAVDADGSGTLDSDELGIIMKEVA